MNHLTWLAFRWLGDQCGYWEARKKQNDRLKAACEAVITKNGNIDCLEWHQVWGKAESDNQKMYATGKIESL